ncbi:Dolichyl-phosphate-mannose-protein mannosyltransferase [Parasphingorhabdus marina DSM 22363]|uniref:Dolichyl-phosphate-mannose-protein mannosyltransferase n=2 Tax=Parasphingorhabdus marina TaxID=394732 RepID=A0A1N6HS29_9SPHN|nr:Dolichyl-phosphate-mannose-protein mannosyltransferase [Parasphingorhabdus marina DSM 22363]
MTGSGSLPVHQTRLIFATLAVVILCQIWLIFAKAINWDEFLHFGQVYELQAGQLGSSIQTLPTRLFSWATDVSDDIISQIQAIRLVMLACAVLAAAAVVALARRLVRFEIALLSGLVFLTAGFVFTNAFTYRTDPVAAAALMWALYVFASGQLNWKRVALTGLLVGFAGALTIKSIFYLPCFAAFAWLRWTEKGEGRLRRFLEFCSVGLVAMLCFALLVGLHGAGLPASEAQGSNVQRSLGNFLRFFEFQKIRYVFAQAAFAPVVTAGLIALPFVARNMSSRTIIMLLGLCGPLLCILFYRNTFPYFFTFLLPPICVAIAPVLERAVTRYGQVPVIGFALLGPIFLLTQEPWGTLERQRATIDEVERLYPEPTPYLSYSGYMPHYPRQFPSLISGVGLRRYWEQRSGQIAEDIEAGRIAFVIATGDALDAIYASDEPTPFLPERDIAALRTNYLQHSDTIYLLGREICPAAQVQDVLIVRSGPWSLDGGSLTIDGRRIGDGATVRLEAGVRQIGYTEGTCLKLWGLDHVPQLPEGFPGGPIAGSF